MRVFIITLMLFVVRIELSHTQTETTQWLPKLVSYLDKDSAPMKLVHDLGQNPSDAEVIKTIAKWFREKPVEGMLWVMPFPQKPDPGQVDPRADKAINHLIVTREGEEQYGSELPWFDPTKKLLTLSRFPHFDYLAPAYYHTGDEQYARAMVRDMMDFIDHVPITKSVGYHVQMDLRSNPWNWVLLQWRVKRWIDALVYLRKSPSVSDAQYLRIILHIWEEIDWLVPRKVLGLHNGTLGNLSAILYTALHFPETSHSYTWLQDTGSFFSAFLDLAFYPGEFLVELTLGYSEGTLSACLDIFGALPESSLKSAIAPKLEKIVDAHVGMMKPDRSLPRYGDHGIYDIRERVLRKASLLFNRNDLLALAAKEDNPNIIANRQSFPFESNPYYLSGYYAMRDGWDVNACYLSIDAGPFGTNHHHGDKLSITLSADGADFIVDPGTSLYRSLEPGPRIDLRPGYLHNVITIDGVDPNTGWDRHYGFDVLDNRWVTNRTYDFIEGEYEFRNNLLDILWRRSIFFKKGEYWVLIDALYGKGEHKIESNFQFMIDTKLEISLDRIVAKAPTGAQLLLIPAPGDGLVPHVVIGDTTFPGTTFPLQYPSFVDWTLGGRGWVGTFGNERKLDPTRTYPAPALVFQGSVTLPHFSVRVLAPSHNKKAVDREVIWLEKSTERLHLQIKGPNSNIIDIFNLTLAQRSNHRKKLEDDAGYWYRLDSGKVNQVIIINASYVTLDTENETIDLKFDRPFEGVITRTDSAWTLFADRYLSEPVNLVNFTVSEKPGGNLTHYFRTYNLTKTGYIQPGNEYLLIAK